MITYTGNKVLKETSLEVNVKTWDAVNSYKSSLKVLLDKQITKSDADSIKALRNLYEELSDVEKAQVDIVSLENLENTINRLINEDNNIGNDLIRIIQYLIMKMEILLLKQVIHHYLWNNSNACGFSGNIFCDSFKKKKDSSNNESI